MTFSKFLTLVLTAVAPLIAIFIGITIATLPAKTAISIAVGTVIIFLIFYQTAFGLYLLILSMLLSPEITIAETAARSITVRAEDFLLMLILFTWIAKTALNKGLAFFHSSALNTPIFAYSMICIFSTSLGVLRGNVSPLSGFFFVAKFIEYFLVYFMVLNIVQTRRDARNLIIALLITCTIVSVYGITQIGSGRVSAPFEGERGEPGTFGGYLTFMLALVLSFFIYTDSPKLKILFGALALVIVFPLLNTLSRASYMAFFPTFIVLFLVSRRRGFLGWLLGMSLIIMPLVAPALKPFIKRASYTFQEGGLDPSSQERVDRAIIIFSKDWLEYPLFGAGVTGRGFIDGQYLRILAETGGLGLLSFLWMLLRTYRMAMRTYKESPHLFDKAVSLGFLSGFIGLLFHALTVNTFIVVRIMEPFWCIAGIVAMLDYLNRQEAIEVEEDPKLEGHRNSLNPPIAVSRGT